MPSRKTSGKETPRETDIDRRMARRARAAMTATLDASVAAYRRKEFLRAFHRLSGETIAAETSEAADRVLRELERALRAERARAGHWTYDLSRHIGLLTAYRAERARADAIRATRRGRPRGA
jgi:hypothetical protein